MKISARTLSALLVATLLALGAFALSGPQAGRVEASEDCVARDVALDEGYGVTRIERREVCAR